MPVTRTARKAIKSAQRGKGACDDTLLKVPSFEGFSQTPPLEALLGVEAASGASEMKSIT